MSGGWKYAGASVIGTSHLKNSNAVCQDANRSVVLDGLDRLVCVVSDGAGSASRAEIGSALACEHVLNRFHSSQGNECFSTDFAQRTVAELQQSIATAAQEHGLRSRDYACTLLVAVVGPERASFWQIGDGAICFRPREHEGMRFAFWPAKGEYANVTEFVTDVNAGEELRFDEVQEQICDLALFSDGLERLALDFKAGEVHNPFFSALFPYLYRRPPGRLLDLEEQMRGFLASDRVNARTDDDKTLILATRENNAA